GWSARWSGAFCSRARGRDGGGGKAQRSELSGVTGKSCALAFNEDRRRAAGSFRAPDAEESRARRFSFARELRQFLYRQQLRFAANVCRSDGRTGTRDPAKTISGPQSDRNRLPRINLGPRHVSLPDPATAGVVKENAQHSTSNVQPPTLNEMIRCSRH